MPVSPQPALKSYFFEQGYKDFEEIISLAWTSNHAIIQKCFVEMGAFDSSHKIRSVLVFVGNLSACISVYIFGSIFSAVIALAHILILFLVMCCVYMAFSVFWLIDRAYLIINKIAISCYECHNKFLFPVYVCPKCGAEHDHLTPGVYGILHRTCMGPNGKGCGEKLPTSILNFRHPRKHLKAICPACRNAGRMTILEDRESRPICIPVVGGASVGKSAFITAYVNTFIDTISIEKGVEIEFYNDAKKRDYEVMQTFYRRGQIVKTSPQTNIDHASSVDFSFFVKKQGLTPERLMHIYDIAGETFAENTENEIQKQYNYCDGIILIIDPFSIPIVMAQYGDQLNGADWASTSDTGIDYIMENFIIKLQETTGLSAKKILKTPLAVVINKVDEADLKMKIGNIGVTKAMQGQPDIFTDYYDTMDYLCREFLKAVDMESVLNHIQQNFKNTRFFAVSAMGHTVNQGRYNPENVVSVFDWIIGQKDKKFASVVIQQEFSDEKLPITFS